MTHSARGWLHSDEFSSWLMPRLTPDTTPPEPRHDELNTFGVRLRFVPHLRHLDQPGVSTYVVIEGAWDGSRFLVERCTPSTFSDSFAAAAIGGKAPSAHGLPPWDVDAASIIERQLFDSGLIVSRRYIGGGGHRWRAVVGAPAPDVVLPALTELYGDNLDLKATAWTAQQYDAATRHLIDRIQPWSISALGQAVDLDGIDRIVASPRFITPEIDAWHSSLPAGLVHFEPMILGR